MVALAESSMRIGPKTGAERRVFPRKEVNSRVQSMRLDHAVQARQFPHLSLALRDISAGGISAITHEPLEHGERIAVYFPPEGAMRGWDASGRVVRCEPSATGYRIGVEFDPLPMAA